MPPWPLNVRQAFLSLAPCASVAGPLCRSVAVGAFGGVTKLRDICAAAGIAEARSSAVEAALAAGSSHGVFVRYGATEWGPTNGPFTELAIALEAVALYRTEVHADTDVVDVVLTPPGNPSRLGDTLRARGWIEAELEHTEAILRHLATQAAERFVVLSPFLDTGGMESLVAMFNATQPEVKRVLVTRCTDGVKTPVLQAGLPSLTAMSVAVHNYWLPRNYGYETFHAKVFLADSKMAYLGSANMTQASLSVSMELGTLLKGQSVKTLVSVVDAILAIAPQVN
jgi:phosphatidylserine/phosphatidylglycerophosphate/cardiolipin synthase-like enzyme